MANFFLRTADWLPFDMGMGSCSDQHYVYCRVGTIVLVCANCVEWATFVRWECGSGSGVVAACAQSLELTESFLGRMVEAKVLRTRYNRVMRESNSAWDSKS